MSEVRNRILVGIEMETISNENKSYESLGKVYRTVIITPTAKGVISVVGTDTLNKSDYFIFLLYTIKVRLIKFLLLGW